LNIVDRINICGAAPKRLSFALRTLPFGYLFFGKNALAETHWTQADFAQATKLILFGTTLIFS
jgi:hypothetical protein